MDGSWFSAEFFVSGDKKGLGEIAVFAVPETELEMVIGAPCENAMLARSDDCVFLAAGDFEDSFVHVFEGEEESGGGAGEEIAESEFAERVCSGGEEESVVVEEEDELVAAGDCDNEVVFGEWENLGFEDCSVFEENGPCENVSGFGEDEIGVVESPISRARKRASFLWAESRKERKFWAQVRG